MKAAVRMKRVSAANPYGVEPAIDGLRAVHHDGIGRYSGCTLRFELERVCEDEN